MLHFFPASGSKTDWLDYLLPPINIEFYPNVNLYPVFYLKAYLHCTKSFTKKSDRYQMSSPFLGNNCQDMPVCTKMISSLLRKALHIVKVHMSLVGV